MSDTTHSIDSLAHSDDVLRRAAELKAAGRPFALVTVVRSEQSTSAKPGAKALVEPDGVIQGWVGGGCAQPAVLKTVKQALADGEPRLIRISPDRDLPADPGIQVFGMSCYSGGVLDLFIEPVLDRPGLLVIGVSPVARALSDLAHRVGFHVTLATPDAINENFSGVSQQRNGLDLTDLPPEHARFVVVASQGKKDEASLEAALGSGSQWIAFVASERKANRMREYLRERGHDAAAVEAIRAPAGVEIGAQTPEEIALSVLAGLVKARRTEAIAVPQSSDTAATTAEATKASPSASSCCGGAPASGAAADDQSATAIDPICHMDVEIATAKHTLEYEGTVYYFCCAGCQQRFAKAPQKYLKETTA